MQITSGSSNYTHEYDRYFDLWRCSEAPDMGHHMPDGSILPTGFSFCPHLPDANDGWGLIVEVD